MVCVVGRCFAAGHSVASPRRAVLDTQMVKSSLRRPILRPRLDAALCRHPFGVCIGWNPERQKPLPLWGVASAALPPVTLRVTSGRRRPCVLPSAKRCSARRFGLLGVHVMHFRHFVSKGAFVGQGKGLGTASRCCSVSLTCAMNLGTADAVDTWPSARC